MVNITLPWFCNLKLGKAIYDATNVRNEAMMEKTISLLFEQRKINFIYDQYLYEKCRNIILDKKFTHEENWTYIYSFFLKKGKNIRKIYSLYDN